MVSQTIRLWYTQLLQALPPTISITADLPRSPLLVTHCPCGKLPLDIGSRKTCADAIPTCPSTCMRPLEGCDHPCAVRCHTGNCPPCSIRLVRPCRCGATTRDVLCSQFQAASSSGAHDEILCERACTALRACGKHQCNRICCPLASLAVNKGKGKKRAACHGVWDGVGGAGVGGLHECDLPCGKMLGCGNHPCEERDHRGACPPCLRSSFEEVSQDV